MIAFLEQAGTLAGLDFGEVIFHLQVSIKTIPTLAEAIRRNDLEKAALCFNQPAEQETVAYTALTRLVS